MHTTLFDSNIVRKLSEQLAEIEAREGASLSSQHDTRGGMSMDREEQIEALEARIDYLKQDSRMCSHRIAAIEDRRKEIQVQLKGLKALDKQLHEGEEKVQEIEGEKSD